MVGKEDVDGIIFKVFMKTFSIKVLMEQTND
jgi:hypothetical protein